MKARKRPITNEVMQIPQLGFYSPEFDELIKFCGFPMTWLPEYYNGHWVVAIETLEGTMRAKAGDWLVRGVKGEIWPVRRDIFAETYDLIVDNEEAL